MQRKLAINPDVAREIDAFIRDYEVKFNNNDAIALAALCTEDAVQMAPDGPVRGRQAIEKHYADFFGQWHPTDLSCTVDRVSVVAHVLWNCGEWKFTGRGENGPVLMRGYRLDVLVRVDGTWKESMSCYNVAGA